MSLQRLTELHEPVSVAPSNQTSTNSYADVTGSNMDTLAANHVVYTIYNAHGTNSIDWKVLASIDDVTYVEVKSEATLTALGSSNFEATSAQVAYRYFKVQVKSTSSGNHGTAQVRGYAKA